MASRWFMRELRLAGDVAGTTQRQLAGRLGMHPSSISRILGGRTSIGLDVAARLAEATGHRLIMKVVPSNGVRLRDSGQLGVAERIVRDAHASWRSRLEVPVAPAPDRRAADLVLDSAGAVVMVEIERWLRDLQAQLRAGQLKRMALSQQLGRHVDLVLAVADSERNRTALAAHLRLVSEALPVGTRQIWAAIRSGESPGGDGLLWVRERS